MAMTLPFHTLRWVTRNYYKMPRSFDDFQGTNSVMGLTYLVINSEIMRRMHATPCQYIW